MHDTWVTVVGNVVSEPVLKVTGGGHPVVNLRIASTPRRYDAGSGEWRDRDTTFLSVSCWRTLAEHVSRSVHRGDPVVVHGRLVQKTFDTAAGERRTSTELEATAVGHDLARGTAAFARAGRAGRAGAGDRETVASRGWAAVPRPATDPGDGDGQEPEPSSDDPWAAAPADAPVPEESEVDAPSAVPVPALA